MGPSRRKCFEFSFAEANPVWLGTKATGFLGLGALVCFVLESECSRRVSDLFVLPRPLFWLGFGFVFLDG